MSYPDRVASKAADFRPARIALTVLAFPFYLLGFLLGVLLVVVSWAWAAVVVGMADVKGSGVTDGSA